MAALVLGPAGGVLDTALLGHAWAACDIGINSAANSYTLVYLVLPVLCVVNGIAAGFGFRLAFAALRGLRGGTGLALAVVVLVLGLVAWAVVAGGLSFADQPCFGGAPGWWPSWLPV